ncbi:MAG: hypothetical protein ABW321_04790 [Polyangiales bacterium]
MTTKRTSKRPAKHNGHADKSHAATQTLEPREQLQVAFDELKASAAHFLEAALNEAQRSASELIEELRTRALQLLSTLRPDNSQGKQSDQRRTHSHNTVLS